MPFAAHGTSEGQVPLATVTQTAGATFAPVSEPRSHASFDAPQFATDSSDDELPLGGDLATALVEGLGRRGYACEVPDPYGDFAWQVDVARDGKT